MGDCLGEGGREGGAAGATLDDVGAGLDVEAEEDEGDVGLEEDLSLVLDGVGDEARVGGEEVDEPHPGLGPQLAEC